MGDAVDIADQGKIFAYDYANDQFFFLIDTGLPLGRAGATYFKRNIYMGIDDQNPNYVRIAVGRYDPTIPSQYVGAIQQISTTTVIGYGDIGYLPISKLMVRSGNSNTIYLNKSNLNPISSSVNPTIARSYQNATSINQVNYLADQASMDMFSINYSNGDQEAVSPIIPSPAGRIDLGGWLNEII